MTDAWYMESLSQMTGILNKLPAAIFTLAVGAVVVKAIRFITGRATVVARLDPTLGTLLQSVVGFAGWVFVLAAATASLGMQQVSLALGGSIALVAMALASSVNSVTQDLLAGVFLIADQDFKVGYTVKAAGLEGQVESVTIRKTKIRDKEGVLHTVPNRLIDNATYTLLDRGEEHSRKPRFWERDESEDPHITA
ncbi:MAG: mechanosensitive ion channel [Firmicutes bacterium]|jgi:small-conductance mechanosensitive channel|nr:mechanosensitive ion channel [Bacillota bacterium]